MENLLELKTNMFALFSTPGSHDPGELQKLVTEINKLLKIYQNTILEYNSKQEEEENKKTESEHSKYKKIIKKYKTITVNVGAKNESDILKEATYENMNLKDLFKEYAR